MIAMPLRTVSNLQRVVFVYLAISILCSQSESNECFKDSKVSGDCPSFSATLVRPGNFSVTLKADSSLSGRFDVEMTFGECKFRTTVYNIDGVKFSVPKVDRPYAKYLSFGRSGTQLRSKEDSKIFCSGLCQDNCDIHFSWDVKPSSSKVYIDFGSLKLVDVRSNKGLGTLAIAAIIVGSVIFFLLLICVATLAIYCCKCKKSKVQKAKPEEAKSKPQMDKPLKQIDSKDKKPAFNEKTREEKTDSSEKTRAKRAEFITSQDLKSPTKDKQKSSSSQKEVQAPKQNQTPQVKKRTGKCTEATLERVLTSREDEKLEAKEAKFRAKNRPGRTFVTLERVLTTHEEEKLAAKEAMFRAKPKKTKTTSRDDATIVE